jgi:hypothetical protein
MSATSLQRPKARLTGAVYLLYFLTAFFAAFLHGRGLIVASDAVNVTANAVYIAVTVLFYYLFKPVNASLSLLAAFFSLAGCAVSTLGVFHLTPLQISPLVFFGPYCLLLGYLILRSNFLPRVLGVLMVLAGVGWLIYLSPLASHLSKYLEALGILAEGSLMLWLVAAGVNVQRWKQLGIRR